MPTSLSGTGAGFASSLTVPIGGDARNAASLRPSLQQLLDNDIAIASPGAVTVVQRGPIYEQTGDRFDPFVVGMSSGNASLQQLDIPHGALLTEVIVQINPDNATPPAGAKPAVTVYKTPYSGNTAVVKAGSQDATASTAYGARHDLSSGTFSETIDRSLYAYHVGVAWESGTGASTGNVYTARATYTVSSHDGR